MTGIEVFRASAPANIALIKYMGKTQTSGNVPANASLSYTLDALQTTVELKLAPKDSWEPLTGSEYFPLQLSRQGQDRFLTHLARLKTQLGLEKRNFTVLSGNNFPADSGIASSASSFAALTQAVAHAAEDLERREVSGTELALLSQQGSGSSCRSFFAPWCLWDSAGARSLEAPMRLSSLVVAVSADKKLVSSTEAHARVTSSALYRDRAERAERRLEKLKSLLTCGKDGWADMYQTCWAEFWDMHALFETSTEAFGYLSPKSLEVLEYVRQIWRETSDGPIATMDAGPNVHLLFRLDQTDLKLKMQQHLAAQAQVLKGTQA